MNTCIIRTLILTLVRTWTRTSNITWRDLTWHDIFIPELTRPNQTGRQTDRRTRALNVPRIIHLQTYIYIYTHIHIHIYTYVYIYMYIYIYLPTYIYNSIQHKKRPDKTRQDNTTRHNTTQHNTTRQNTTRHNTTQHDTTQHIQYNAHTYILYINIMHTHRYIYICIYVCVYVMYVCMYVM